MKPSEALYDSLTPERMRRLSVLLSEQINVQMPPEPQLLGVGFWGCVFEARAPWVVKITVDPTEAGAWSLLDTEAQARPQLMAGAARIVGTILRILPDVELDETIEGPVDMEPGDYPVFVIAREAAEPARHSGEWSEATYERTTEPERYQLKENLLDYRKLAYQFYEATRHAQKRSALKALRECAARLQREAVLRELGVTLEHLATIERPPRDTHLGNIAWRSHEEIPGWESGPTGYMPLGLILIDPGHTPTGTAAPTVETFHLNRHRLR